MLKKVHVFFFSIFILYVGYSQTIVLEQDTLINPNFPIQVAGFYNLDENDTLITLSYKSEHELDWITISQIDTSTKHFTFEISTDPGDGYIQYFIRITTKKNQLIADTLHIFLDRIAPEITEIESSSPFMNANLNGIRIDVQFSEIVNSLPNYIRLINSQKNSEFDMIIDPIVHQNSISFYVYKDMISNLELWQGPVYIQFTNITDEFGNLLPSEFLNAFSIDTFEPAPPTLTSNYPFLLNSLNLTVSGSKEQGSLLVFEQDTLFSFQPNTTWSKTIMAQGEGEHHYHIFQMDSAGNVSSPNLFSIKIDTTKPRILYSPALTYKLDSLGNEEFKLAINFSEYISLIKSSGISLMTKTTSIPLASYVGEVIGNVLYFNINNVSDILTLKNCFASNDSIFINIDKDAIEDLAGNSLQNTNYLPVIPVQHNYIKNITLSKLYINPDESNTDSLYFKIILQEPQVDSLILFLYVNSDEMNMKNVITFQGDQLLSVANEEFDIQKNNDTISGNFYIKNFPDNRYNFSAVAIERMLNIGSKSRNISFWIDRQAPVPEEIIPSGNSKRHPIEQTPKFTIKIRTEPNESPVASINATFHNSNANFIRPFQLVNDSTFMLDLQEENIKLDVGPHKILFQLSDSAGNINLLEGDYYIADLSNYEKFDLYNYPNPFNPKVEKTFFSFVSDDSSNEIEFLIYDISFKIIFYKKFSKATLLKDRKRFIIPWDGYDLNNEIVTNGVFFAVLKTPSQKSNIVKVVVNNR